MSKRLAYSWIDVLKIFLVGQCDPDRTDRNFPNDFLFISSSFCEVPESDGSLSNDLVTRFKNLSDWSWFVLAKKCES